MVAGIASRRDHEPRFVALCKRMTGEVKDRHAEAVPTEDLVDLGEGGVGPHDQLAQAPVLSLPQDRLELPGFLGQVAQVSPAFLLVGEGEEHDGAIVRHDLSSRLPISDTSLSYIFARRGKRLNYRLPARTYRSGH